MSGSIKILAGMQLAAFTVVRLVEPMRGSGRRWLIRCTCGAESVRSAKNMTRALRGRPLRCSDCVDRSRAMRDGPKLVLTSPKWMPWIGHECDKRCALKDANGIGVCCLAIVEAFPGGMTDAEIASILGWSSQRVREIATEALAKVERRAKRDRLGE